MTLVLSTSKAQLLLMLLFAHKLRSCWCLHTNLTLQNIQIFFKPLPQEFSVGGASLPRSLKGCANVSMDNVYYHLELKESLKRRY